MPNEELSREQFTFYSSFFRAIRRIKKKADRAEAYDAICEYALCGTEPNMDELSDAAAIAFELVKPNLDASRKRSFAGKNGGKQSASKREANGKQNESKSEANPKQTASKTETNGKREQTASEKENEIEREKEIENECYYSSSEPSDESIRQNIQRVVEAWNGIAGIAKIERINSGSKRYQCLKARLDEYGVDKVLAAIEKVKTSDFLRGKGNKGWWITFDWFVLPNNFPKVLEGNYDNRKEGDEKRSSTMDLEAYKEYDFFDE